MADTIKIGIVADAAKAAAEFRKLAKGAESVFKKIGLNAQSASSFIGNTLSTAVSTAARAMRQLADESTEMALALETASPRQQKVIRKNLNIEKLRANIEYITKTYPHVVLDLFTMHGFPTETEEEALMTLDFIKSIKWLHFPLILI